VSLLWRWHRAVTVVSLIITLTYVLKFSSYKQLIVSLYYIYIYAWHKKQHICVSLVKTNICSANHKTIIFGMSYPHWISLSHISVSKLFLFLKMPLLLRSDVTLGLGPGWWTHSHCTFPLVNGIMLASYWVLLEHLPGKSTCITFELLKWECNWIGSCVKVISQIHVALFLVVVCSYKVTWMEIHMNYIRPKFTIFLIRFECYLFV
jgi:hypothetical protein